MKTTVRGRPGYYLSRRPEHTVVGALRGVLRVSWFLGMFFAVAALSIIPPLVMSARWYRVHGAAVRRFFGRQLCRAAGARITRVGTPPRESALFVSNHLSWLDSFIWAGEIGGRFVANHPWSTIPLVGTALRRTGVLFIRRASLRDTRAVADRLAVEMRRGDPVIIFPEAKTTRGATVLPFRPALLEAAARGGVTVDWGVLRYETPPGWPPAGVVVSWEDWTPLLLHVYRAFHPPYIGVEVHYGAHGVTASTRKELAAALHRAVSQVFVPQAQMAPADLKRVWVSSKCPEELY